MSLHDYIKSVFPELKLIKDEKLREKVIKTWVKAIEEGGWTEEDLENIPFTLLIEGTDVNIIEHTRAVTLSALRMAEAMKEVYGDRIKINFDYLIAGGLLHDVGKLLEYEKRDGRVVKSKRGEYLRHPFSGILLANEAELPWEVLHEIAVHAKEGEGRRYTVEAILINHADFANFEPFKLSHG